jgi:rod shape-determining protein MreC
VAAFVLLFGAVLIFSFRIGSTGRVASAGDDAAAASARVANGPFRSVQDLFRRVAQMWRATDRIAELERDNRDLRVWRVLAERLAERNARYEALLRLPPEAYGEGVDLRAAVGAQLVLDSGGPFTRTLVANAGSEHGVRVGYIAVNENGLVGRVVSVGRRSARVLLLDDYNSRVPVMGAHSRERAVMVGQAAQRPDLLTRPFEIQSPRLQYSPGGLRNGEPIITSGDGGLYPRGIRVGFARQEANGEWSVALSASQQPIDFVRIIPFLRPDAPERSGVVADSGPPLLAAPPAIVQAPPPPAVAATAPTRRRIAPPRPEPSEAAPPPPTPIRSPRSRPPQPPIDIEPLE